MEKKKHNYFWWILFILFTIFMSFFLAYDSNYYESSISKKSRITQEKIREFEQDVKDNKEIDIKNYVEEDNINYSSAMSNVGAKLSSSIDDFMQNGLSNFFDVLGKLFT